MIQVKGPSKPLIAGNYTIYYLFDYPLKQQLFLTMHLVDSAYIENNNKDSEDLILFHSCLHLN